jgi:hypothetical protein
VQFHTSCRNLNPVNFELIGKLVALTSCISTIVVTRVACSIPLLVLIMTVSRALSIRAYFLTQSWAQGDSLMADHITFGGRTRLLMRSLILPSVVQIKLSILERLQVRPERFFGTYFVYMDDKRTIFVSHLTSVPVSIGSQSISRYDQTAALSPSQLTIRIGF